MYELSIGQSYLEVTDKGPNGDTIAHQRPYSRSVWSSQRITYQLSAETHISTNFVPDGFLTDNARQKAANVKGLAVTLITETYRPTYSSGRYNFSATEAKTVNGISASGVGWTIEQNGASSGSKAMVPASNGTIGVYENAEVTSFGVTPEGRGYGSYVYSKPGQGLVEFAKKYPEHIQYLVVVDEHDPFLFKRVVDGAIVDATDPIKFATATIDGVKVMYDPGLVTVAGFKRFDAAPVEAKGPVLNGGGAADLKIHVP